MSSPLAIFTPLFKLLPEVKSPTTPPTFSQKMVWTLLALIIFYAMYNVAALGVSSRLAQANDFMQIVTASKMGSLLTTGIGPIVLASIFLQLFVGAKILNVDLKDPEQKAQFYGTQKILAVLLCLFEAYIYVFIGHLPLNSLFPGMEPAAAGLLDVTAAQAPYTAMLVMLQIALGSLMLLFLDEVVSKHGIGSGISLFIAAGVSLSIVGGAGHIFTADNGIIALLLHNPGAEVMAQVILILMPLFFTILVFLIVVYVEGLRVEIPLSFDRARGVATGFPIKFTYVSNIPVILAFALIANFSFVAMAMGGSVGAEPHFCLTGTQVPYTSPGYDYMSACRINGNETGVDLVNIIGRATPSTTGSQARFVDGILYYITPMGRPNTLDFGGYMSYILSPDTKSPIFGIPEFGHVIIYIVFLMIVCVIFGQFWVETTGMGPKEVAEQLDSAGLQIPGFRRDPRVVTTLLEKYIPPIVVLGSAFVGLLAGVADLTGALGTGTGILLTVSILYKFYQDIERQHVFETSALMGSLFGKR